MQSKCNAAMEKWSIREGKEGVGILVDDEVNDMPGQSGQEKGSGKVTYSKSEVS